MKTQREKSRLAHSVMKVSQGSPLGRAGS